MMLNFIVDDQLMELNVPEALIAKANDFFQKMDGDMDQGWQMGREWVDDPSPEQRCQVAANKLLTAVEEENHQLGRLMAGYIIHRMPGVEAVTINTAGEIQDIAFTMGEAPQAAPAQAPAPTRPRSGTMSKMDALAQAGEDVTKVFKVGKGWRYSIYDHANGQWQDAPLASSKEDAERLREEAFRQRFQELTGQTQ